jgi:hypothetical protein
MQAAAMADSAPTGGWTEAQVAVLLEEEALGDKARSNKQLCQDPAFLGRTQKQIYDKRNTMREKVCI